MKFTELKLPEFVLNATNNEGFVEMTEIQEKCIPEILAGKDVIGKSQTGSGKTFAYGIPTISIIDRNLDNVQTLIVCPTRELASQVCDELRKITSLTESIKTVLICGGSNMARQIDSLRRNTKIVVGTPGRIMDHLRRRTLKLNHLKTLVLDEADEMLNMGFKEDVETILKSVNVEHQTIMFSATMPKPIMDITKQFMKEDATFIEIGKKIQLAENIEQKFVYHDKKDALIKLFGVIKPSISIVFCNTKRMVDEIVKLLSQSGMTVLGLHGDMRQNERRKNISEFKSGNHDVLVGTDVAARGLDVKDVDLVINYDLPNDMEYYIHRIGRTGRAGKCGLAVSLINTKSQIKELKMIKLETKTEIQQLLLDGDKNINLLEVNHTTTNKTESGDRKGNYNSRERNSKFSKDRFSKGRKEQFSKGNSKFSKDENADKKSYKKDRFSDNKISFVNDDESEPFKKSYKSSKNDKKSFKKESRFLKDDNKNFRKEPRFSKDNKSFNYTKDSNKRFGKESRKEESTEINSDKRTNFARFNKDLSSKYGDKKGSSYNKFGKKSSKNFKNNFKNNGGGNFKFKKHSNNKSF